MSGRSEKRIQEVVYKDYDERVYHKRPTGISAVAIGAIVVALIAALSYLAFAKSIPFTSPDYEISAVFENATTLRENSPVRIAGITVGEVTDVSLDGELARASFSVDADGLPLRSDAQVTIRPRLFLEGNFFLDLDPGSPSAEPIDDGGSIPVTQTATAVQIDEILTALQRPDRENLSRTLRGYGSALDDSPSPAEDRTQDPDVRGLSAAQALNKAFDDGAVAGKSTSQVSQALLGSGPRDLSRFIDSTGRVFEDLAASEAQLRQLIGNFATTAGAFAAEQDSLRATLAELAPTLEQAEPSLRLLNTTFPPLRGFSRALVPGVRQLPATIEAGNPWLRQANLLLTPDELGGLAKDLGELTPPTADATNALAGMLPQLRLTSLCVDRVLAPAGDLVIGDEFSTGASNFRDFFYGAASQSGEGGNFDGNGPYLRVLAGGDAVRASAPNPNGGFLNETLFADTISPPIGSRPLKPGSSPPVRTDVDCHTNELPDVNGPRGASGAPTPAVAP